MGTKGIIFHNVKKSRRNYLNKESWKRKYYKELLLEEKKSKTLFLKKKKLEDICKRLSKSK